MKTTDKVINKLFYRMREMYGSYWVSMLGNESVTEIKEKWLKSLNMFSAEEIGKALSLIKQSYAKEPPNLIEFKAFVKKVKHQKAGHLSNKIWNQGGMEKADKSKGIECINELKRKLAYVLE